MAFCRPPRLLLDLSYSIMLPIKLRLLSPKINTMLRTMYRVIAILAVVGITVGFVSCSTNAAFASPVGGNGGTTDSCSAADPSNCTSAQICTSNGGSWLAENGSASMINGSSSGPMACYFPSQVKSSGSGGGSGGQSTPDCTKGGGYCCGSDPQVQTSVDFGCKGQGNPILDMTFGIIRFLSAGVGIVIVGSMVVAGIQYTSARGDPNASAKAKGRIQSNVIALLIFIFAYAILNYVIPGAVLK